MIVNLNECLKKVISSSFTLLMNAGKFPPVPRALMEEGATMKVEFVGPLAQAQQKYHAAGGINQALGVIGPIIQMDPTSADNIDFNKLMKHALRGQGMPEECIREEEDVEKIRQARAEQQAAMIRQQQQQDMLNNIISNAGSLGQKPQEGSVMNDLNNQLRGGLDAQSLQ